MLVQPHYHLINDPVDLVGEIGRLQLGTIASLAAVQKHEHTVQHFKRHAENTSHELVVPGPVVAGGSGAA